MPKSFTFMQVKHERSTIWLEADNLAEAEKLFQQVQEGTLPVEQLPGYEATYEESITDCDNLEEVE